MSRHLAGHPIPCLAVSLLLCLGAASQPAVAIAQTGCWDYAQGPVWNQTVKKAAANDLFLFGDLLFTTAGYYASATGPVAAHLSILDTADPLAPVILGSLDLVLPDGTPTGNESAFVAADSAVAAVGVYTYLMLYDTSDPTAIVFLGDIQFGMDRVFSVAMKDSVVVVATSDNYTARLRTIDISDPANPVELDAEFLMDVGYDLKIKGNYCYVATDSQGLTIWSLHDPANLIKVQDNLGSGAYTGIDVNGNYAVLCDGFTLTAFDISQPLNPVQVDEIATPGYDVAFDGTSVFCTSPEGDLIQHDVMPNGTFGPQKLAAGPLGGVKVVTVQDVVYTTSIWSGLQVFLPRSGPSAQSLGYIGRPNSDDVAGMVVRNDYLAVLTYRNSNDIRFYDLVDPSNIVELTNLDISTESSGNNLYGMTLCGQILCVPDTTNGVLMYDWSTLSNPHYVGRILMSEPVTDVSSAGNQAYLSAGALGIIPVNLSNPSFPAISAAISVPGAPRGTFALDTRLFIINGSQLYLLDVTDPDNPVQQGSLDISQTPQRIAADGDLVYVAGKNKLYVIDVADMASPILLGTAGFPWSSDDTHIIRSLVVAGPDLYLTIEGTGMFVLDVSDPSTPRITGSKPTLYNSAFLALNSSHLLLSNDQDVLLMPQACQALTAVPEREAPRHDALQMGIWPNPFNPMTTLSFELGANLHVTLDIFDLAGRHIVELADRGLGSGRHEFKWQGLDAQGRAVPSGVYFARLRAGELVVSRRMALVR